MNVKVNDDDPEVLLDSLIEALGATIDVSKEDLEKIPKDGTFITVSNHPFGGLDGIVLVRLLCKLRLDYKKHHVQFPFEENSSVTGLYLRVGPGVEQEAFEYASD
ncbi:MAG: hypothetical protein V8R91_18370 [Butyricimonas faecihominis]